MKEFASGLPGPDLRTEKSFETVIAESRCAIQLRRQRELKRRLYSSPLTERIKEATKRMIGERDA
jgi:hypothetical protein